MAETPVLGSFATLQNSSIVATLNANNKLVETAFEDCLSRSGTSPNQMQANLDMNGSQIINLPPPATLNSPVRLVDINSTVTVLVPSYGVTPESYGAIGNGIADDTAAFTAMGNAGRAVGSLYCILTSGKTYTCSNPFVLAGIKVLIVEGNGAQWMNNRATPITGFTVNYTSLCLGNPFWNNGANPGNAQVPTYGTKINTVNSASSTVTATTGNCPTGTVLLYGSDRLYSPGFPPCPAIFEYNTVVSAVGSIGTLECPTSYHYDAQWPEVSDGSGGSYGTARILSCNNNTIPWTSYVHLKNINFIMNPAFVGLLTSGTNGAVQPSGGDNIIIENCSMSTTDPTMARNVTYLNCDFYASDNNQGVQPDKIIENLIFKECRFPGILSGAIGVKNMIIEDCVVTGANGVSPIENYEIVRGRWSTVDFQSTAALLGDSVSGTERVKIEGTKFVVPSTVDRIAEYHVASAAFTVVSTTTLSLTRTAYDASQLFKTIKYGSILRNITGIPAFRVTRTPYTTGNLLTGVIQIDGETLSTITTGDTLILPNNPNVEFLNPYFYGVGAPNITSYYGTAFFNTPYPTTKVRDRFINDSSIKITSQMSYSVPRGSNLFKMQTGGMFSISSVVINVTSPSIGAAALNLNYLAPDGTSNQIYQSVDLTTVGKRIVDRSGSSTPLGGDTFGTSSIGSTNAQAISWVDGGAALSKPNQPIWSATFYGTWVADYEQT